MFQLKPDRLNGQTVYRPVSTDGGVNHVNDGVLFPPGIKVGRPPILSAQELVESALRDLVTVSDQHGDPLVKAQAILFRKKLAAHQTAWLKRAADNEREVIRAFLKAHGFNAAAEAI
jgi:hypothetical protein